MSTKHPEIQLQEHILNTLSSFDTYEEKHNYLTNGTIGSKKIPVADLLTSYSSIQDKINVNMITSLQEDVGTSGQDMFSWSDPTDTQTTDRDLSNKELAALWDEDELENIDISALSILDNPEVNKLLEENEGKTSLMLNTNESGELGVDKSQYQMISDALIPLADEKSILKADIEEKLSQLTKIKSKEEEEMSINWWNPAEWILGNAPLSNPAMGPVGSYAGHIGGLFTQLFTGWSDAFKEPGMEKIDNELFRWNPEQGHMGWSDDYKQAQDILGNAYSALENFEEKYEAAFEQKAVLDAAINKADSNLGKISETILDDLIEDGYLNIDDVQEILK
jgi:hypothetical protein